MIDVILIDDEMWICKLIRSIVDWNALGFNIVAEANDGITALELIKRHQPRLVITDIRMPGLDGIGLIKATKELPFKTEFIIVSGYSDFEYARSAISYAAFGYLLKPLDKDTFSAMLLSASEKINRDYLNEGRIELSRIILQKESIINLMMKSGDSQNTMTIQDLYHENGLHFREGLFQIVIFQIDPAISKQTRDALKLSLQMVTRLVNEHIKSFCHEAITLDFPRMKAVIAVMNFDESKKLEADHQLKEILEKYKNNISLSKFYQMTIGAGCPVDDINEINISYISALNGIKSRIEKGKETVIYYCGKDNQIRSIISVEDEKKLNCAVELFDISGFDQLINELFKRDAKEILHSPLTLFQAAYDIADLLTNTFRRKDISIQGGIDRNEIYENINSCSTVPEITEYLKLLFRKFAEIFESAKKLGSGSKLIDILKKNIAENYMKDINLNDAAKLVCLNSSYLSELFKKETGENFSEYLTDYRISIAKGLLKDVKYRVIDVAESVGYTDPKYFSRVFKKHVGINPTEYKQMYT